MLSRAAGAQNPEGARRMGLRGVLFLREGPFGVFEAEWDEERERGEEK